jgi:hypothetical protein
MKIDDKFLDELRKEVLPIFTYLQPYCISIYLGGSLCEEIIENTHDIDFICFSDQPIDMCHIRRLLFFYQRDNKLPENLDFIQVRTKQREEHAYGSYINRKMIKLCGEDIEFNFDVININRDEYKKILVDTIDKLDTNKIRNQKRWYQVIRGYFILKNNSYDLSDEQKSIVNIVHDQVDGWEQYKITKEDIERV